MELRQQACCCAALWERLQKCACADSCVHRRRRSANGAAPCEWPRSDSWGGPGRWAAQGPLQVRPCKLGRRIHAAHAPAQPIYPATDTFLWRLPTEKKKKSNSGSLRSELSAGSALLEARATGHAAFAFDLFSSCVGGRRRKPSEAGRVGCAGVSAAWMPRTSPHGWIHGVPCAAHLPGQPS